MQVSNPTLMMEIAATLHPSGLLRENYIGNTIHRLIIKNSSGVFIPQGYY
jgi:hypothetical protein